MTFDNILLEQPESGIYLLTVNRPTVLNALNPETIADIGAAVESVDNDKAARAMILTGAGDKAFVAGADISRMRDMTALEAKAFSTRALATLRHMERLRVPVIAAVNGYALGGGCELAMACDMVLASERAVFGQPEVNLGVPPGFGGTQRLTRRVGPGMAMEMLVTGRTVKAPEAREIGLVNHVYPPAALLDRALEMAGLIATRGPVAVGLVKEAVQRGQDLDLDNACALESEIFALAFSSADQTEGMTAFLDKRTPRFEGR